ncbi:MAG: hypothetical protein ACE5HF_08450 [Gemmatimonadota bacterium]
MAYRKFVDRAGRSWEVRDLSRAEWTFEPLRGNDEPARRVRAPGYQNDPYELSDRELQALLDSASGSPTRPSADSLFKD